MARFLRPQFEGALYHIIVRGVNRQPLFKEDRDREHYLDLLDRCRDRFGCFIYAFILFRRHVHICLGTPRGNVGRFMQCLGTSYAAYFNRKYGRRGTLFEGRYRSRLVVKERHLPEYTRYIHWHCFPKRLKQRSKDFRWSSYRFYLVGGGGNFVDTGTVLSQFGIGISEQRKRYQEFVENGGLGKNRFACGHAVPHATAASKPDDSPELHESVVRIPRQNTLDYQKALEIIQLVSISMGMNGIEDLQDRKRRKSLARHLAMYLIRRQTPLPLHSIGALLGVKAPAVNVGIGKVERLIRNGAFPSHLESLVRNCDLVGGVG